VYRSGIFALRGELAFDAWSRGTAGIDSAGALRILPEATIGEVNVEVRIAGVTIFWAQRNVTLQRVSYVPGSIIRVASSSTACAGCSPTEVDLSALRDYV